MKRIVQAILVLALLVPLTVSSQTTTMQTTYTWTAPTTGSAVHHYEVQVSAATPVLWVSQITMPTTTTATVTLPVGSAWIVRVRGIDAQGRAGVWSDPSLEYTPDAGAPGACGRPVRS